MPTSQTAGGASRVELSLAGQSRVPGGAVRVRGDAYQQPRVAAPQSEAASSHRFSLQEKVKAKGKRPDYNLSDDLDGGGHPKT